MSNEQLTKKEQVALQFALSIEKWIKAPNDEVDMHYRSENIKEACGLESLEDSIMLYGFSMADAFIRASKKYGK